MVPPSIDLIGLDTREQGFTNMQTIPVKNGTHYNTDENLNF